MHYPVRRYLPAAVGSGAAAVTASRESGAHRLYKASVPRDGTETRVVCVPAHAFEQYVTRITEHYVCGHRGPACELTTPPPPHVPDCPARFVQVLA